MTSKSFAGRYDSGGKDCRTHDKKTAVKTAVFFADNESKQLAGRFFHLGLQVILNAHFVDQFQLSFQPVDMLFF